jgi:glycerate 2-kinase
LILSSNMSGNAFVHAEGAGHFRDLAMAAFHAGIDAGRPEPVTRDAVEHIMRNADAGLPVPTAIIAIGKAACAMADAARQAGCMVSGIIVTNDENYQSMPGFDVHASAHPVPDIRGLRASDAVETLAKSLTIDDHLLLLISGGGSALLPAPASGISLADKMALNEALLASGLDIHDMNVIRRLFSRLKGGRLAALAMPARISQFLLSDVPGDRLESIASGVAAPEPTSLEAAIDLVRLHGLDRLDFVPPHLDALVSGKIQAPLGAEDPVFDKVQTAILASNNMCRSASRALIEAAGDIKIIDAPDLDGDAAQMGKRLADCALSVTKPGHYGIVVGGETTVKLDATSGIGGRAQEVALTAAIALGADANSAPLNWTVLVGGTDGRDGPCDAAGAIVTSHDMLDIPNAKIALQAHDCYPFLKASGQLVTTGGTGTNLGDLAIILFSR